MTRIAYRQLDEMTEQARELTVERGNLNVYRALANADKVFTGWMLAGRAALGSKVLPVRLRELVVLRTAYLMDSRYELGQHRDVARTAGVSVQEINAVISESDWEEVDFVDFSDTERSVLRLTSELLTTRRVSGTLFDHVRSDLGSEATIEILMLIGRYAGLALMLNALDVDLDESARLSTPMAGRQDRDR